MFADKDYIQKRAEMMKNGVSWSELAKLQSDYDRRSKEQERMNVLRKSQDRKKEMDYYYQMKMKRVQDDNDRNEQLMRLKEKEQDDLENSSRSQWQDIQNKIDYRQNLAEKLGSRIVDFRNQSKEMPPPSENMTLIYETNEYKMRRVQEARLHQERLKQQLLEKEQKDERVKKQKLEDETAYLRALGKQQVFEDEEKRRRKMDLNQNQQYLKRQMDDRRVREDNEDKLTKEEIAYNRYMFVPSRPPYL